MSNSSGNSSTSDERKESLRQALQFATTVEENLRILKEMETCFEESELGRECFLVALAFLPNKLDQVISYGKRALNIATTNNDGSRMSCLLVSCVLRLLGYAHLHLKMYDESLSYLNRGDENLSKLDHQEDDQFYLDTALDIQKDLFSLKKVTGRKNEVVVHAKKVLEIKEKTVEEKCCVDIAKANQDVCEAYFEAFDLESGLPYCLKAKEIYTKCLGPESVEVANMTRQLALIYYKSGENEKALALTRSAANGFKKMTPNSRNVWAVDTQRANMLITMGRYEEAAHVLKGVLQHTDMKEGERALIVFTMARALFYLGKYADAEQYLSEARGVLERKEMHYMVFAELSQMYEKLNDLDAAISMIKKVLAAPELPHKLLEEQSARLFSLASLSGKGGKEIPYMEGVVKKLKKSLGPRHLTTLKISHGLSVAYAGLGSCNQALEIEEKVFEGLTGLAPSELGFMHDVSKHLSKMKEKVAESSTTSSSQSKEEGSNSAKFSKCGISDDGKGN